MSGVRVRHYLEADWPMVDSWWKDSGEMGPLRDMMPTESSFIAEYSGVPALAVTVYLTNTKELAYVENFIGNPRLKGQHRQDAAKILADHISGFARAKGYRRLMCMTEKPVLKDRYVQLGFRPTLSGVTTFVRNT